MISHFSRFLFDVIGMKEDFHEGGDDFRIEEDGGAAEDFSGDFGFRFFFEVRRREDGGVVVVGHGDDAGAQGDIYIFQMLGKSGAVPTLVVAADVGQEVLAARDGLEHVRSQLRMLFEKRQLSAREVGRFRHDLIWNAQKADVVEEPGVADEGDLIGGELHVHRCGGGVIGHADGVFIESIRFHAKQFGEVGGYIFKHGLGFPKGNRVLKK